MEEIEISRVYDKHGFAWNNTDSWSLNIIKTWLNKFNENEKMVKSLGYPLTINDAGIISIKGSKLSFPFKPTYAPLWKDAVSYWQVFIVSKFKYLYNVIIRNNYKRK